MNVNELKKILLSLTESEKQKINFNVFSKYMDDINIIFPIIDDNLLYITLPHIKKEDISIEIIENTTFIKLSMENDEHKEISKLLDYLCYLCREKYINNNKHLLNDKEDEHYVPYCISDEFVIQTTENVHNILIGEFSKIKLTIYVSTFDTKNGLSRNVSSGIAEIV